MLVFKLVVIYLATYALLISRSFKMTKYLRATYKLLSYLVFLVL